ncbi:MAG: hypothetical protein QOD32_344 [Pyrinomonadaceae bacterium]|jgi:hypothetical protein|nr:hypothetical protein [Pyrinomonadaceae bacterium]
MKLNLPKFERLHILIITLLVLLVPFSLYYWGFVRVQTTYFTEHKSRQLAVMSNQIGAKLKNLGVVVENASVKLFESAAEARKKGQTLKESEFEDFGKTLAISDRLEPPKTFLPKPPRSANAKPVVQSLTFKPECGMDVSKLVIEFTGSWDDGSPAQSLQVNADLGGVLQSILSKEAFDSVIIADAETGAVVHQHNRQSGSKLRVATLDALRDEQQNKIEHVALAQATNIQDVKLAGVHYTLFSRPVEVGVTVSGSDRPGLRWIVVGLISEAQFRRERLAISYTVLIVFTVVMILAALSWSFLKLWLMGAKDRLRIADVYFLFFSAIIGAALLTLFSLYIYTYISLSHDADDKLQAFAMDVHDNLHDEVGDALDELDKLNEDLLADPDSLNLLQETGAKNTRPGRAAQTASAPKRLEKTDLLTERILTPEAKSQHPYPFFTTAFWVDDKRQQRIKWTTRDAGTRFVSVPLTRAYYNNVNEGRFLHLPKVTRPPQQQQNGETPKAAKPPGDQKPTQVKETPQEACKREHAKATHHYFWLEPITSPLAGVETVIVSKKMCAPYPSLVAALDTRLLSMIETVTPPGYGFSIIEENGRVLFHSELAQHFEENFYDECDERAELRAAVEARQSKRISTDYLGSGHTLYTLPVKDFPGWTIITYRDKQILRTMQLELLVVASNLFLIYCLLLLIPFVFIYIWKVNTGKRGEWLWARDEAVIFYRRLSVFNVLCCLIFSVLILYSEHWRLFEIAVAIPLVGLSVTAYFLRRSGRDCKGGTERNDNSHPVTCCRNWYVGMMTTLMFIISVLPAISFFKLAYNEQMQLFAKHGQVKLAEDLRAREERVRGQYAGYVHNPAAEKTPAAKRAKKVSRAKRAAIAAATVAAAAVAAAATNGWIDQLIRSRLGWSPPGTSRLLDVYESVLLDTRRENAATDAARNLPPAGSASLLAASDPPPVPLQKPESYEQFLSNLRPIVNRTSGEWAGLIEARSADEAWEWGIVKGDRLQLQTWATDMTEHAAPLRLSSNVPFLSLPLPGQSIRSTLWWISLVLIFVLVFFLLRFVVMRVFLLRLDDPTTLLSAGAFNSQDQLPKRFVVLGAPFLDVRSLLNGSEVERLSLVDAVSEQDCGAEKKKKRKKKPQEGQLLAIDNFDYRSNDQEWDLKRLELLERLRQDSRPVVVFSRHDPFRSCYASYCALPPQQSNGTLPTDTADRWMNVVSSFWVIHIEDTGGRQAFWEWLCEEKHKHAPNGDRTGRSLMRYLRLKRKDELRKGNENVAALYDTLANECGPRTYLQNVAKAIPKHPKFKDLSPAELIRLLVEQAEAYYKAIWATCTDDQKLTLYYLAQDRLVSAKNVEVRRLMRRGLIVRDPDVRLMNESFRHFILSTVVPDEIGASARTGSSWSKLRLPLLVILVGIALFLLVTHPDMYSSSMAIITALATGIPAVFQLLGMFQRNKSVANLAQLPTGMTPPTA